MSVKTDDRSRLSEPQMKNKKLSTGGIKSFTSVYLNQCWNKVLQDDSEHKV